MASDTLVWVQIRNPGPDPITASFSDALHSDFEFEDGSGHASKRVFGARSCAERHRILPQESLVLPMLVQARKPGKAVVQILVEARRLSAQGKCLDEYVEGSTTWEVQVK